MAGEWAVKKRWRPENLQALADTWATEGNRKPPGARFGFEYCRFKIPNFRGRPDHEWAWLGSVAPKRTHESGSFDSAEVRFAQDDRSLGRSM